MNLTVRCGQFRSAAAPESGPVMTTLSAFSMRMTDRVAHIVEEPQACDAGNGLFDQLDALARKFSDKGAEPRDIPARVGKACTTPTLRGSPNRRHDDRNRRGGILGRAASGYRGTAEKSLGRPESF
jgi:hypothetical protein